MHPGFPQGQAWQDPGDKTTILKLEMTTPLMLCVVPRNYIVGWNGNCNKPHLFCSENAKNLYLGSLSKTEKNPERVWAKSNLPNLASNMPYTIPNNIVLYATKIWLKAPPLVLRKLWIFTTRILVKNPEKPRNGLAGFWTFKINLQYAPMPSKLLQKTACNKPQWNPPPISWKCRNHFSKYLL